MPAYKDEKQNTWYCQFYYEDWYNGSVVKTKKLSFYNELTSILGGRENPPSSYLNYATYGRSIAG